jgi:hypothetical protein
MDNDGNFYRQLLAIALAAAAKAAVDYVINPASKEEAVGQVRDAFQSIDYDAVAKAITRYIDATAESSKGRLSEAIDTLRDRSVDAVDEAKNRAETSVGKKKGSRGRRFLFGIILGAILGYFMLDEQRRDELLDRLTGASGPIETSFQSTAATVTNNAQQAVQQAQSAAASPGTTSGMSGGTTGGTSTGGTGSSASSPASSTGTSGGSPTGGSSTGGSAGGTSGTGGTSA